jgi:threonine synthase
MRYFSTRGETPPMAFTDAVLTGLAPDGGLLLPATIPDVRDRLASWRSLGYVELAQELIALFVDDIPRSTTLCVVPMPPSITRRLLRSCQWATSR